MPRRDGTGPMGFGYRDGKCLGFCAGANTARYGADYSTKTHKELLLEQREILRIRLETVEKQLENL